MSAESSEHIVDVVANAPDEEFFDDIRLFTEDTPRPHYDEPVEAGREREVVPSTEERYPDAALHGSPTTPGKAKVIGATAMQHPVVTPESVLKRYAPDSHFVPQTGAADQKLAKIDQLLKQGSNKETALSEEGLKIVRKGVVQGLYFGDTILPVQGSTLRILELVSLQANGITFGGLRKLIDKLTDGHITEESLRGHLSALRVVFEHHEVPGWQYETGPVGRNMIDGKIKLKGAVPRRPQDWPAYLKTKPHRNRNAEPVPVSVNDPLLQVMLIADDKPDWQESALCKEVDPETFFPYKSGSTSEAKKICNKCEVRTQCLQYALTNEERFGIWGGLSERSRRRLKRETV